MHLLVNSKDRAYFDLEAEIRGETLDLTKSEAFNSAQEGVYTRVKACIDQSNTNQLTELLKQGWAKDPDNSAIIGKALVYTISTDLPQRGEALKTIIKNISYASKLNFITQGENYKHDTSAVSKTITQLIADGYVVDIGKYAGKEVIKPDYKLSREVEDLVKALSSVSQQQGVSAQHF